MKMKTFWKILFMATIIGTIIGALTRCSTISEEPVIEVNWDEVEVDFKDESGLDKRPPFIDQGRDCTKDDWRSRNVVSDTSYRDSYYVVNFRNANGNNAYWHNPEGDFARVFFDYDDNRFLEVSYNKGVSEDVVQTINGVEIRFPAVVRKRNGLTNYKHKRDSWEHDVDPDNGKYGEYTIEDATGDTVCLATYQCDYSLTGVECNI